MPCCTAAAAPCAGAGAAAAASLFWRAAALSSHAPTTLLLLPLLSPLLLPLLPQAYFGELRGGQALDSIAPDEVFVTVPRSAALVVAPNERCPCPEFVDAGRSRG